MTSLVLWDIDGTLVDTDQAGERALLRLFQDTYAHDFQGRLPVDLRGRTDTSIWRDLLAHSKWEQTADEFARLQAAYLTQLALALPLGRARVLPGVREALDAIAAHASIHQGLLTGNIEAGARLKLEHLDLWHYFEFGAFADDSANRNELGPFALRRAQEKLGLEFPPDRVWIVGDTPHDVSCGKAIGAKTLAVATGKYTLAELQACGPTRTLLDLSSTLEVVDLILAG